MRNLGFFSAIPLCLESLAPSQLLIEICSNGTVRACGEPSIRLHPNVVHQPCDCSKVLTCSIADKYVRNLKSGSTELHSQSGIVSESACGC